MDDLSNEIELLRRSLKEDIFKVEKAAEARAQEILAKSNIEFCSRCNRKVDDRMEWAGKCLGKTCNGLICNSCWISEKKRFCREHANQIVGVEKRAKEKSFFKEPEQAGPTEYKSDENRIEKIDSITANYIEFIKNRFNVTMPDWTPTEYIENSQSKTTAAKTELDVSVLSKGFLRSREKLKIVVRPLYGIELSDLEFNVSKLGSPSIFTIAAFVGHEVSSEALEYVRTFNNDKIALFVLEPVKNLVFHDSRPSTKGYARWFDFDSQPTRLRELLRSCAEKVSGRDTVTISKAASCVGLSEAESLKLLESCKFLEKVEDTDTFFFKW